MDGCATEHGRRTLCPSRARRHLRERARDLTDRIGYAHHNIIDERLPAAQHAVRKLLWTTHEARHRLIEGVGHTCRHLREEPRGLPSSSIEKKSL